MHENPEFDVDNGSGNCGLKNLSTGIFSMGSQPKSTANILTDSRNQVSGILQQPTKLSGELLFIIA